MKLHKRLSMVLAVTILTGVALPSYGNRDPEQDKFSVFTNKNITTSPGITITTPPSIGFDESVIVNGGFEEVVEHDNTGIWKGNIKPTNWNATAYGNGENKDIRRRRRCKARAKGGTSQLYALRT